MPEDNGKDEYIPLRKLINEAFVRDVILFTLMYLLVLSQSWCNFLLLLFPIITFSFSIFFRIISANKWRYVINDSLIEFYPLGIEKRNANRFSFISFFLLTLLFWIGAESIYHPQLIDMYFHYFKILFILIYTFGFFWIFTDAWKNYKIIINAYTISKSENEEQSISKKDLQKLVNSSLSIKTFKKVSIINTCIFILVNLINIAIEFLLKSNIIVGISYYLPGTGIEGSNPVILSIFIFFSMIISPACSIISIKLLYRDILNFNEEEFKLCLNQLPSDLKENILSQLEKLGKKFGRISKEE